MKLSAPIYILKQQAKSLPRKEKIPLHQALDLIANREGFSTWSLLAARWNSDEASTALLSRLSPGDLVLLGDRPGLRETLLADYTVARLESAPPKMLVIIDYLQLLEQKRDNPSAMDQVAELKRFARER